MSVEKGNKVKWTITDHTAGKPTEWTSSEERSYTGTIGFASNTYTLTIEPGTVVTEHNTLRQAKNQFRKYLLDK